MTTRQIANERLASLLQHGLGERWTIAIVGMIAPDLLPSKAVLDDHLFARADRLCRHAVEAIEEAIDSGWLAASEVADLPLGARWGIDVLARWPGGGAYLVEHDGGEAS